MLRFGNLNCGRNGLPFTYRLQTAYARVLLAAGGIETVLGQRTSVSCPFCCVDAGRRFRPAKCRSRSPQLDAWTAADSSGRQSVGPGPRSSMRGRLPTVPAGKVSVWVPAAGCVDGCRRFRPAKCRPRSPPLGDHASKRRRTSRRARQTVAQHVTRAAPAATAMHTR